MFGSRSKVVKLYLGVQGIQMVHSDPRYVKRNYWFKVYKEYLVIQGIQRIPSSPMYVKGTLRSKVRGRYIVVQDMQRFPTHGPGFSTNLTEQ